MRSNSSGTNITIVDAMIARGRGGGPKDAPSSFWTPNIVRTRNSIVVLALAKPMFHNYMVSSSDGGKSWVRDYVLSQYQTISDFSSRTTFSPLCIYSTPVAIVIIIIIIVSVIVIVTTHNYGTYHSRVIISSAITTSPCASAPTPARFIVNEDGWIKQSPAHANRGSRNCWSLSTHTTSLSFLRQKHTQ